MAGIKYWLWLRSLHGLNNSTCLKVLAHFGSPEGAYYADSGEYDLVERLTGAQKEALQDKSLDAAERILEDCARLGIRILTMADAEYPERLRSIPDAPCLLYVKGAWPDFDSEAAVAIIGTRRSTPYGIAMAENLGCELAEGGAYIVSGMAAGGDAAGQRGALRAGKRTAAVLGCGLDVIYPAENEKLYYDILANGVLLSEYPPGTPAYGNNFLQRNRIISGLSVAVIVVEAGLRSGTMNTVRHATEQGRDVYAVPGPVNGEYSRGCNRLIQEGAGLVTRGWDVLSELQHRFPDKIETKLYPLSAVPVPENAPKAAPEAADAEKKQGKAENQIDKAPEKEYIEIKKSKDRFTDDQIQILSILSDRPMNVDDIAEAAQLPVRRVLSALTFLEIEHVVTKESGNRYCLNVVIVQ